MDQTALVRVGKTLVSLLDKTDIKPRAALWVYNADADTWRLWIVPEKRGTDQREFYRALAGIIAKNREALPGFDISLVELTDATNSALKGLSRMVALAGDSELHLRDNTVNGIYMPDSIVLRLAL